MPDVAGIRILVIGNSDYATNRVCESLLSVRYPTDILTTYSAIAAVSLLDRRPPDFVVLDLDLHFGSGLGILKKAATALPKPFSIVLTDHRLPDARDAALQCGANHCLDKQTELHALPVVIESIIELRHWVS